MSHRDRRAGGKFCGSHMTVIPTAAFFADIAQTQEEVSKIMLGFIQAGLSSAGGQRRVKFKSDIGSLLLFVRDNMTYQELRVYSSNVPATRLLLARFARNNGIHISFQKKANEQ
ncbi:MAG TPA: DUF2103 domain-containing protein [Candidatus Andersenbacteria bacterium]|nr:DUF2103 domain-containing protein [Candidatus Andersenbacteria bacterium]